MAQCGETDVREAAISLPGADLDRARAVAGRKGISYQTLLRMLGQEVLARQARRQLNR